MTEVWDQYRDLLIGCWENISYEMFVVDASHRRLVAKPHGETPLGRLSISPQGWVAAHLARPDRMGPLPSGKPWMTAPDQEVAHVARGLSMYCGYMKLYRNDEGQLYWQTRVEVSTDPSRMGGIEERKVTLVDEDGKTFLFLEPKQDMLLEVSHASAAAFSRTFEITDWSQDGTKTRAVLKWEKFE